jgi:hypothetical protein
MRKYKPHEFQRKITGVDDRAYWKGSQYKNFALYIAFAVLRGVVDDSIYF